VDQTSFLAHDQIPIRAGPNSNSTLATSSPATCSMKWARVHHAWLHTPPPCYVVVPLLVPKGTPELPLSLVAATCTAPRSSLTLPRMLTVAMDDGAKLMMPLPSPMLRSLSISTKHVTGISSSGRPSYTPFLAILIIGTPCHRRCHGPSHWSTWPGHLKPPQAKPRAPLGAPHDGDASPHLPRSRHGPIG
jgi:hypothetical protein